jgi:hypothetical protein
MEAAWSAKTLPQQTAGSAALLEVCGEFREDATPAMGAVHSSSRTAMRTQDAIATALQFLKRPGLWTTPGCSKPENFARIARFAAAQGPGIAESSSSPTGSFGAKAVEALFAAATEGAADDVRTAVLPLVEEAMASDVGTRRFGLLRALPHVARYEAASAMLGRATDPTRRKALIEVLLETRHPGVAPLVAEEWKAGRLLESRLRRRAVGVFESALHQPALDLLREALADADAEVREAAQKAFATFKKNREALQELEEWKRGDAERSDAVAELMRLLDHEKPEVVIGAVRSLGALKAKAALPKLVRMLELPGTDLRTAINEAIAKIGS